MTTIDGRPPAAGDGPTHDGPGDGGAAASRRWRSVWRIHFYSGMFALPFIALMAVTGLVILYTQPIQDLTEGELRKVDVGSATVPYDEQVAAVERAHPHATAVSLTPPAAPDRATVVGFEGGHGGGDQAFVDPYTGDVLGTSDSGGGIVGLANRLHGSLDVESVTVDLPTASALWDGGPVMRPYVLFDLVLELLGVWTLVLVCSGLFLWWPRRSRRRARGSSRGSGTILGRRRGVTGRARLRDLHGLSGVLLVGAMVVTIVSGLGWSTYWGANFGSLADTLTPGDPVEAPPSSLGTRGDLDRLGNRITWNSGDFPVPASYAPGGTAPPPHPCGSTTWWPSPWTRAWIPASPSTSPPTSPRSAEGPPTGPSRCRTRGPARRARPATSTSTSSPARRSTSRTPMPSGR
ncbi:MAG TPA: PepSY domain-containing protein [Acidimicrobiales bacterium]|nr:PepSY domain-containing protein [Acidimicrobiales bacterium]